MLPKRLRTFCESTWKLRAVAVLAALGCLQFVISLLCWHIVVGPISSPRYASDMWEGAGPAAGLFLLAMVTLVVALRRKWWSVLLLVLFFVASAGCFAYDVTHERGLVTVDIATIEYWESGGLEWWYI